MSTDKNPSSETLFRRFKTWAETYPFVAALVAFLAVEFILNIGAGMLLGSVKCYDGWPSVSIGHNGACSWHGGVDRSRDGWIMILSMIAAALVFVFSKRGRE